MPITSVHLETGDILFKHASQTKISQAIRKGQTSHYKATTKQVGEHPLGMDHAIDITHAAIAMGPDDVLEFDEGGASKSQIIFGKGYGFVRGAMNIPSRRGKRYEVFKCTRKSLAVTAADKAELVWDVTHQGPIAGSYGLGKMVNTALRKEKGETVSLQYFEQQLDQWLKAAEPSSGIKSLFKKKPNIQLFCSEFVSFCYLWAAAETKVGKILGVDYLLGIDKVRMSPVELYTRIETKGKSHFSFRGTLYVPG